MLAIDKYCFIAASKVKRFANGIAQCFPEQEKVFECAEISARDPSCDLLRRLACVAVISPHRSHAGRQVEGQPPLGIGARKSARSSCAGAAREGSARIP